MERRAGPQCLRVVGIGALSQATKLQACELVEPEMLATPFGPDIDKHLEALRQYADAGVDELFVQQIGPERDAFFDTWAREVLPRFA